MTKLTREQFIALADQAGLALKDNHFKELFADVQAMFDRLQTLRQADIANEEPGRTAGPHD